MPKSFITGRVESSSGEKCPHCGKGCFFNWATTQIAREAGICWSSWFTVCPICYQPIIKLFADKVGHGASFPSSMGVSKSVLQYQFLVYPKNPIPVSIPKEVPENFSKDFHEAYLVLPYSAKASAALSRRILQDLLREEAKVHHADLSKEIQEVLDSNILPSYLAEEVDAIRNVGNFATHPIKSTNTREIVEVKPGEAEWLLNVLEGLFDFYFVQPKRSKARKNNLNEKLKEHGKPPMKEPKKGTT